MSALQRIREEARKRPRKIALPEADEPRTLQDLGEEFGVSRERVRQLEKRVQLRLKDYLDRELGADVIEG